MHPLVVTFRVLFFFIPAVSKWLFELKQHCCSTSGIDSLPIKCLLFFYRQGANAEQARQKVDKKIKKLEEECERRERELEMKGEAVQDSEKAEQDRLRGKLRGCDGKLKAAELLTTIADSNNDK